MKKAKTPPRVGEKNLLKPATNDRYSNLFHHSNDAIILHDIEGNILEVNRKAVEKFGFSEAEMLQKNIHQLYPPDQAKIAMLEKRKFETQGFISFEVEFLKKNGERFPTEVSAIMFNVGGKWLGHSIIRDFTRRKRDARLQAALYQIAEHTSSVEDMRAFYAAMHKVIAKLMYADNFYIALYNRERDVIISPYFVDEFDKEFPQRPTERKRAKGFTEYIVETGEPLLVSKKEIAEMIEAGKVEQLGKLAVDWLGVPLRRGERTVGVIAVQSYREDRRYGQKDKELLTFVAQHISNALEKRRYLNKIATEEKRLKVTMYSIGDGVITTDIRGKVLTINRAAEKISGWQQSEIGELLLSDILKFEDDSEAASETAPASPVGKVLANNEIVEIDKIRIHSFKEDIPIRTITLSAAPIHNEQNNIIGVVLAFRDITEKIKLEKEWQKMQKLESVGVLAGGIAHDFNNILTAIIGNISMAKKEIDGNPDAQKRLGAAEKACQRAKDLTQQLLTFSKGGEPIKKVFRLSAVVKEAAEFALSGSKCQGTFYFAPDLAAIEADQGQISQVVNNIVLNAEQSMPNGGEIKIRCTNFEVAEDQDNASLPLRPGKYVRISIEDSGVGIPENYIQQVFDPYFTTKHQGSGLGLATCYSIISKHGGYITVRSETGNGSLFSIFLPASAKKQKRKLKKDNALVRGKGQVLVMDDEKPILELMSIMLMHLGFTAVKAESGEEAIEIYREAAVRREHFEFIIMDLTVPGGLGGKDTLKKIKKINPDVKAIVASGYSNDPVMSRFKKYGFRGRIRKPFNLQEISEAIKQALS